MILRACESKNTDSESTTYTERVKTTKSKEKSGNFYKILFDLTYTSEEPLLFQESSVSLKGQMVNESLLNLNQEVLPENNASPLLAIQKYKDEE
ncbi:hypothetical protein MPS01_21720 [Marinilactibacillus psychrotolerans]|uniref:Lipoprotein n=1 Tax=Marinilactibacillus psychrotolerans TaxID=191770 RepID=A0AAV3WVK2_9LACT|nr:hypothetical protein [Marinilactibacillus psychrotolerans]GEL68017.1 hypothetical protein MPS01_21720 [Marinilactibacillus psychrotolerans]GEQ36678.1 hypothetical protein M132T_21860 [Marinilactibacillus psychrotolerans]SDD34321.1 hypothetical protein SAMN04488013_12631 [Marinilactibacillus psychrotolerans]